MRKLLRFTIAILALLVMTGQLHAETFLQEVIRRNDQGCDLDLIFKYIDEKNNTVIAPQSIYRLCEMCNHMDSDKTAPAITQLIEKENFPIGYTEKGAIITAGIPSAELYDWGLLNNQIFDLIEVYNFDKTFFSDLNQELKGKTGVSAVSLCPRKNFFAYLNVTFKKNWKMSEWQHPFNGRNESHTDVPFVFGKQIVRDFSTWGIYEIELGSDFYMRLGFDSNHVNFNQLMTIHQYPISRKKFQKREVWIPKMDIRSKITANEFFRKETLNPFIRERISPFDNFKQSCTFSLTKDKIATEPITMMITSTSGEPKPTQDSIVFDKPFKFVIVDKKTNKCLIAGHYTAPFSF